MNTLVIVAHPSLNETSIANRMIVERIRALPRVAVKNLHQEYPSFTFNVDAEQDALRKADSVVFQFPFYWYSVPGILKEWMDQVLTYGFAYGSTGNKLKGKHFLVSTTIGGPADAYCEGGYNNFTIGDLLKPLRQMSNLTGMVYHKPIVSHGMIYIPNVFNTKEDVEKRAAGHAEELRRYITKEKTEVMPSNQAL